MHLHFRLNSLAPGKFELNFRYLILQMISAIDGLWWMSLDLTDDKSTLVQVMAWCHQTTSHYLSLCWPRSLSPYGITRPQWVNTWLQRIGQRQLQDEKHLTFGVPYIRGLTVVNSLRPSDAYMRCWTGSSLVQIMACRLFGAKPLSEPMLEYR